jgi:beta-lactamase regulating signal transducer with metallopeptidase domain
MYQVINTFITELNNLGRGFWDYAAGIFVQVSLLVVLLLILDFILRKRVRAVFRYCLWMLLFVKLVLPASFTLPTGIGYWLGDYFPSESSIAKLVPQAKATVPMFIDIPQGHVFLETPIMNETVPAGVELESISWQGLAFSGWLVGMLVLSVLVIRRYCYVKRLIADSRPANERSLEMLDECRRRMGIRQSVELRLSGNKVSPAVCGLFKPVILVPAALLRKLSREKLKAVLIHELAHIKRGDAWVHMLQTILQIVYFYNPLVWIANAMVRRVREQAIDEMVLVTLRPETKNYSNMLIDIAEMAFWRPNFSLSIIGVVESKKALERRINHMLTRPVPKSSKLGCLGLIAIVIIGAILLPMGRNSMAEAADIQENSQAHSKTNVIIPGLRVGDYTFNMSKDDLLKSLGEPKAIFFGNKKYTLDDLPEQYFMDYGDISFHIAGDTIKGITALSPYYKFPDGLGVGATEQKIEQAFGDDFKIEKSERKDFLSYKDKGLMFEINKQDRTVMEINVSPLPGSESYKIAEIPPTSTINEQGRIVDKVDYPFVNDPKVIGGWKSVDFVQEIDQFNPTEKNWKGDLYLNHLIFEEGGKITGKILTWTKDLVLSDDTASKYIIKDIDGSAYMFFEWKSGDYTIRRMKPFYYVLKKVPAESLKFEPMFGKKADIPSTSTINEDGRIVDKIDYPFVNDPQVIGTWKSVDFVGEMEDFKASEKKWKGDLYLKELIFLPNGKTSRPWQTWTKGLVFHSGDKTASKYTIKNIEGSTYMFFEWKSGDYIIRYRKPSYYVLKKVSSETGGLAEAWASQPSDAEFNRQLPAKIKQLDIDNADLEQVKKIFGKPAQYVWGKDTFTEDNLPERYILVYPSQFRVFMSNNKIVEIRHESGFKYVFRGKLRSGSTLDEVFEVIGRPKKIIEGEENKFEDGVLYKDIDGRKGHCYYARSDQDVRLWFSDYKLAAIYMTRSDN